MPEPSTARKLGCTVALNEPMAPGMQRVRLYCPELAQYARGAFDGVRDVVELEVEEDLDAAVLDLAHQGRALGIEELHADLGPGKVALHKRHELEGALARAVEGNDGPLAGRS